jgi:16S rRNA processing protein RimM
MNEQLLEVGKVLNTHGVRGELKCESWCDEPEDLCALDTVYVNAKPYAIQNSRIHGAFVLLTLEGIGSIDDALPLKGKIITASRDAFQLEEGVHFVVDLIGLEARDANTGAVLGKVKEVLSYPAHDIYVIEGERQLMIPDVPDFVKEIHAEEGYIDFTPLEGM